MFACVLACANAAARVMLHMSHAGVLPRTLQSTNRVHGTPGPALAISSILMFLATEVMATRHISGFEMYDFAGSLAVFGFLTAYALVAAAVPFAERASGQSSVWVAFVSVLTVVVMVLISIFDIRSSSDSVHTRIPFLYLLYVAIGLTIYFIRATIRKN
jgi:amino acid transporter